jgi:hypothetical protein
MNRALANLTRRDHLAVDHCLDVQRPIDCEVIPDEAGGRIGQQPPILWGSPVRTVLNNRCAIVGMLAFVGPLGLPFLWLSHRFSRRSKIAVTVIFFLLTVVLPLAFTYYWVETAIRPLLAAFRGIKH